MPSVDLSGVNVVAIADREDETAATAKAALPVAITWNLGQTLAQ